LIPGRIDAGQEKRATRAKGHAVILVSYLYRGIALLVTEMRIAILENGISERVSLKKIFIFGIFLILRVARLVAREGSGSSVEHLVFL
jgi:hypothetical protein